MYILTRFASLRTSKFRPACDFAKLTHLTSYLWQKNPGFRKNSLCDLIWPDFGPFESADWPLKSSTNFRIWCKICFCLYDLNKLPTQRLLKNAVFDANLNSRVPSGLFGTLRNPVETRAIVGNSKIYFTILIYFYHHIVALRCVDTRACAKQAAWNSIKLDETSNNITWFEEHWDTTGKTAYRNKTDEVP